MRHALKGLIFDVDGTLLDSNDAHARAWVDAFSEAGHPIPYATMRRQVGKGGDLLVPDLLDGRQMRRFGLELEDRKKEIFEARYKSDLRPFDGVKEAFREIRDRGIPIVLATSAGRDELDEFLGILDISELIDGTTTSSDADVSKPSPEIFRSALEIIGTAPNATLVVGDTPWDVLAAHRCALSIAAVLCGGFERELLAKAELIYDDVPDLVSHLDEIDEFFAAERSDD